MDFNLFVFSLLLSVSVDCIAVDVKTTSGLVRGQTKVVLNQTINEFIGIPFAEPPIGALRFAKPKPIEKPLTSVIDATKKKNSCMQGANPSRTLSEDCLFLSVWSQSRAANDTKLKPVMFWIYGGGLQAGSVFDADGSVLAAHDVVFAATNYRLGSFGFLYGNDSTAPGNLGFYDQNLALKWVHANIHMFGGDKDQITIFGESAGSWSVSAQLLSPLSKGLFKRAILQSGAILYMKSQPRTAQIALQGSKNMAKKVNCTDDKTWLECLRKVDAKHIQEVSSGGPTEGTEFLPVDAQTAFHEAKFNKDLDLIAGVVKTEGSLAGNLEGQHTKQDFINFVTSRLGKTNAENITDYYLKNVNLNDSDAIRWKISDFFGDIIMNCPTYLFAKRYYQESTKANVFFYQWTHTGQSADWEKIHGIPHASDVGFVFGGGLTHPKTKENEVNYQFTQNIVKYWTNFVKYGKTNAVWPEFVDKSSQITTTKILNPKEELKTNQFNQCETFWKNSFL